MDTITLVNAWHIGFNVTAYRSSALYFSSSSVISCLGLTFFVTGIVDLSFSLKGEFVSVSIIQHDYLALLIRRILAVMIEVLLYILSSLVGKFVQ